VRGLFHSCLDVKNVSAYIKVDMGSSQSSHGQPPLEVLARQRLEAVQACFSRALASELQNGALSSKPEREIEKHFRKLLDEQCLKPNNMDPKKDAWAASLLKQASCTFARVVKQKCSSNALAYEQCKQDAMLRCTAKREPRKQAKSKKSPKSKPNSRVSSKASKSHSRSLASKSRPSKPRHSSSKPRHSSSKPRHSSSKPRHSSSKPRHSSSKPRHS
jgi:hypothetical protein